MSDFTEALDVFFNGRMPGALTEAGKEIFQLRREKSDLRALVRSAHSGMYGTGCNCWVCRPPKSQSDAGVKP